MSKLKEELEHYIDHCQMFSHRILFIGAFIAWVWHPSISSLEGVMHSSPVSLSLGGPSSSSSKSTWGILSQWEKFPPMLNWFPVGDVVQIGIFPYMNHDWLSWVLFMTAWHGGREAKTNFFTCCDISGLICILAKGVCRWASLTLVSFLLYKVHVEFSTCNGQSLVAIPSHLDV